NSSSAATARCGAASPRLPHRPGSPATSKRLWVAPRRARTPAPDENGAARASACRLRFPDAIGAHEHLDRRVDRSRDRLRRSRLGEAEQAALEHAGLAEVDELARRQMSVAELQHALPAPCFQALGEFNQ